MPGVEMHPSAARSFDAVAEAYERARPGYAAEAVEWLAERLALTAGSTVIDLGAGTGKLTRQLLTTGAEVIAVEPVENMRRVLADAVPAAEIRAGAAEAIPAPDASTDAVTAGQAAHWFRPEETIAELVRVLRTHGGVAFVWNSADPDDPVLAAVERLVGPYRPRAWVARREHWERALERARFMPLEPCDFGHVHELGADDLPHLVSSYSFIAGLPTDERDYVLRRVRAVAEGDCVRLRYRTEAYVCRRVV